MLCSLFEEENSPDNPNRVSEKERNSFVAKGGTDLMSYATCANFAYDVIPVPVKRYGPMNDISRCATCANFANDVILVPVKMYGPYE